MVSNIIWKEKYFSKYFTFTMLTYVLEKINEKLSKEGKFSFFFISLMSWHIAQVYYVFKNFSIPVTQTLLADISLQMYFTKLLSNFQFKEYQWNLTHNLVLFESTFLYIHIRKVIAYITIHVFISGIVFVFLLVFFFSLHGSLYPPQFTALNLGSFFFFFVSFKWTVRKVDVEKMTDGWYRNYATIWNRKFQDR